MGKMGSFLYEPVSKPVIVVLHGALFFACFGKINHFALCYIIV